MSVKRGGAAPVSQCGPRCRGGCSVACRRRAVVGGRFLRPTRAILQLRGQPTSVRLRSSIASPDSCRGATRLPTGYGCRVLAFMGGPCAHGPCQSGGRQGACRRECDTGAGRNNVARIAPRALCTRSVPVARTSRDDRSGSTPHSKGRPARWPEDENGHGAASGRLSRPLSLVGATASCVTPYPCPRRMCAPPRAGSCRHPRSPAPGRGSSPEAGMQQRQSAAPFPARRTAR